MQTKRGEPNEQAEQEPEPAGSAESAAESEPAESEKRSAERLIFFPEPMGVPVGFTYFYLFAEDFGMGAVRTAGRSAAPAAAGTRVDTKVSTLVNPVFFISYSGADQRAATASK